MHAVAARVDPLVEPASFLDDVVDAVTRQSAAQPLGAGESQCSNSDRAQGGGETSRWNLVRFRDGPRTSRPRPWVEVQVVDPHSGMLKRRLDVGDERRLARAVGPDDGNDGGTHGAALAVMASS